jgi:pimeloyl-ACP methyl ester carboxylesterase
MPHPLRMRHVVRTSSTQGRAARRALSRVLAFQAPMLPERGLAHGDGVERVLRGWGGPDFPSADEAATYREAMRLPFVSHCSVEYFRWAVRSVPRRDGRRFAERMRTPIGVPVLGLTGALDPYVTPASWQGSDAYVRGPYREHVLAGAGHFLPEEAPEEVTDHLLSWLKGLPARD